MIDFLIDNTVWIALGILALIIGFFIFVFVFFSTHCLKSHEGKIYYHEPTYVMSGKVLIPVGGGEYGDTICDTWKK